MGNNTTTRVAVAMAECKRDDMYLYLPIGKPHGPILKIVIEVGDARIARVQ